ncbi:MAG: glycosyltransferase family 2 protein, partial [Flavitalea sp.]
MELKISLITATYNSYLTVTDTLKSVATQTHPDIEHIIIDGESVDNTLSIVKKFPHVHTVVSEKDKGLYDAMNKGIALATGDVVGIINSDDFYAADDVIEKVAVAFQNPSVDMVYGDMQYVDKDNPSRIIRDWKAGPYRNAAFYYGWMPPHPTLFVRRSAYDLVGNFNTTLRTSADYELMIRLFVKHNLKSFYIPELL